MFADFHLKEKILNLRRWQARHSFSVSGASCAEKGSSSDNMEVHVVSSTVQQDTHDGKLDVNDTNIVDNTVSTALVVALDDKPVDDGTKCTATVVSADSDGAKASGATQIPSDQSDSNEKAAGFVESVYHIKWVSFKGAKVPIVTQNENGPCPLLAVMNVLLLQGRIKFPAMIEMVTSGQLMEYLGDCVFENAPEVSAFIYIYYWSRYALHY